MRHPICRTLVCPLLLLLILPYGAWSQSVGPALDLLDDRAVGQIRRPINPSIPSVSSNLVLIDVSALDQEGQSSPGIASGSLSPVRGWRRAADPIGPKPEPAKHSIHPLIHPDLLGWVIVVQRAQPHPGGRVSADFCAIVRAWAFVIWANKTSQAIESMR
jgi:hypothetical protein